MLWSFKPCYKWNTFNTHLEIWLVLNQKRFKPCYKWNTFNTRVNVDGDFYGEGVLNLVISGIPSILLDKMQVIYLQNTSVLNLVISGIPSILQMTGVFCITCFSFKPCYKWNTFNTLLKEALVLKKKWRFKPCYKWNTFNTDNPHPNIYI